MGLKLASDWMTFYQRFWPEQLDSLAAFLSSTSTIAEETKCLPTTPKTLRFKRHFKAGREEIFRAWTDPKQLGEVGGGRKGSQRLCGS